MIDPAMLHPTAIAQSLRSLASRIKQDDHAADRLTLLSEAVEKNTSADAQMWNSVDISKVIDPEGIAERYRQRRASSRSNMLDAVETLRNILIFMPIVVTWFGISQATSSYNDYISTALAHQNQSQLSQPFLYLWQQGFGGRLNGLLTLSNVALIDVGVLGFIIILTLLAYGLASANRSREEERASELYMDLVHTIARATLVLNATRQQPSLVGGSNSSQLNQVVQEIQNMSRDIMTTFTNLENDLMKRMDSVVDTFTQRFSKVTDDLSKQLQSSTAVYGSLSKTTTSLQQLSKEMSTTAQNLADRNREMADSVNRLIGLVTDLTQQQNGLIQAAGTSVSLLQDNTKLMTSNVGELQGIAKQQASWNNELTVSLSEVRTASEKLSDLGTQFGDFVTQLSRVVTDMGSDHVAQRQLAEGMAESMRSTQGIEKYLKELAVNFRQIAVDTNDILHLYAGLPRSLNTDMVVAIQTIEKGGNDLSAAAQSFFTVSQFLEKVVADQEQVFDGLKAKI